MKHLPFKSVYRPDYEVVEERQGKLRLYPHTAQLPVILRAIHNEFYAGLPPRIARVDHRASDLEKIVLKSAAIMYCNCINGARPDELRLSPILDRNLVSKPAIVQHITEDDRRGRTHRFRFYVGNGPFVEKYLCGRRVVFADHVLERFSTRTENFPGEDVSHFIMTFFGNAIIGMPVGPGRAFVMSYHDSILALPYKEQGGEYFVTTCLTVNEIHTLEPEVPPHSFNVHYDLPYIRPTRRNWVPIDWMLKYIKRWEAKVPAQQAKPRVKMPRESWQTSASFIRDITKMEGRGPGWHFGFMDDLPGPVTVESPPDKPIHYHDELEFYQGVSSDYDWEWIIAERVEQGTFAPPRFPIR